LAINPISLPGGIPVSRRRLNVFIESDHARQLADVSAHRGVSQSSVVAAALASVLSPDGMDQREAALARRLDRLTRQFDRLERDQNVLIETVALYVRYFLTVSLPVPEERQEAARAQGRARYASFIEQLGRQVRRGHGLVREIHEELDPAAQVEPASARMPTDAPPSGTAANPTHGPTGELQ
jgi:hypothetical protein